MDDSDVSYPGTPLQGRGPKEPGGSRTVYSDKPGSGKPAMDATADIFVLGLVVDGEERGVAYIDLGYVQDVVIDKRNVTYASQHVHDYIHQKEDHIDAAVGPGVPPGKSSTLPWLNSANIDNTLAYVSAITPSKAGRTFHLHDFDSPSGLFADSLFDSTLAAATYANFVNIFHLFVAAHTRYKAGVGADLSTSNYVAIAEASWSFDGSGAIAGAFLNLANAKSDGDKKFKTPTKAPVTTGTPANMLPSPDAPGQWVEH